MSTGIVSDERKRVRSGYRRFCMKMYDVSIISTVPCAHVQPRLDGHAYARSVHTLNTVWLSSAKTYFRIP
jgi:hypothetical protein